jgi:large subunit ribosomal protein L33
MGRPSEMREGITLQCNECKNRNYQTVKNKRNDPDRIELKKYCKFCRAHTLHKETR